MTAELEFYARIGAALFPCPANTKNPTGIVANWSKDHSTDPAQWRAWRDATPGGCNFGIVAGASRLIICDIDVKQGRAEAWAAWCELCASWGIPVAMPQISTPSGGWHCLFRVPEGVDADDLRQPDAIKRVVNIRAGNGFCIAAGSTFEDRPYTLLNDADPYPAPAALVEHCTRRAVAEIIPPTVELDRDDVAAMLRWMASRDAFAGYEDWLNAGFAIRSYDPNGIDLWRLTHDDTVTPDVEATKWASFDTATTSRSITINSLMHRAHSMGWRGTVRKSTSAMFGTVAASAAGARTIEGMPLLKGQATVAELGRPVLASFNDALALAPDADAPRLPDNMRDHELFAAVNSAVAGVLAMVKSDGAALRNANVLSALAVVAAIHNPTFDALLASLRARVPAFPESKVALAVRQFEIRVSRELRGGQGFITDKSGRPDASNSDNVTALLNLCGLRVRWNAFFQRKEISNGDDWKPLDDAEIDRLYTIAHATDYDFNVHVDMLRRVTHTIARENEFDPLLDRINRLESQWDGTPRLSTWLARACGTPCDLYHQAVARNLVGGLVRRARKPGAKHDEVVLFLDSTQGTGKSSLCKILALEPEWHTDSFRFEGTPQNTIPQLGGKWLIELSDLAGYSRRDVEHVKSFISTETDSFTPKFHGDVSNRPRRCIFVGTSNDCAPLSDTTGNRRFLPVQLNGEIDLEWMRANVEQIVAEAAVLHSRGASFAIPREVWGIAGERQEAARGTTATEDTLERWLCRDIWPGSDGYRIKSRDLINILTALKLPTHQRTYAPLMERWGYKAERLTVDGSRERYWIRGPQKGRLIDLEYVAATLPGREPTLAMRGNHLLTLGTQRDAIADLRPAENVNEIIH